MRLFAVRVIEDKQAVGFFWAPDFVALWWMIDSVCDPGGCEYRRINDRAAIIWEGWVDAGLGTGIEFDDATGESEALNKLRDGISFEYAFEDYIIGKVDEGWTKVPFADEPGGGIHELYSRKQKRKKSK